MATRALDATPPTDEPVAGTQPVLSSRQLRKIAEAVAGYRESPTFWLVLTQDADGSLAYEVRPQDPGPLSNAVVIPCHTPKVAERPPVTAAFIQAAGAEPVDLLHLRLEDLEDDEGNAAHTADAVFWGESSVEKFVVPYYASVYGDEAGEAVTELLNAYNGVQAESARLEEADGVPNLTEVYGLVHIPRSEYIELDESDSTSAAASRARRAHPGRFAVLAFDRATGEHRVVTVEEYRKRRGGAR